MIVHKTNNAAITVYYLHSCILLAEISNNVNYRTIVSNPPFEIKI